MTKWILVLLVSLGAMGTASASVCANWLKSSVLGVSPLIQTERLVLRRSYRDRSDSSQYRRLFTTPDVRREFGPEGRRYGFPDIHVHRAGIGTYVEEGDLILEIGIFNQSGGELLGAIKVRYYQTRSDVLAKSFGISYSLMPDARGKGIVREALAAVIADVERQTPDAHFHVFIADDNEPSLRIARHFDFKRLKGEFNMDGRNYSGYVRGHRSWLNSVRSYLDEMELGPVSE